MNTAKPTRWLLMHRGYGRVAWCELEGDEWIHVEEQPQRYQIFVVDGQTAKIIVATEDWTLKRTDAVKTASLFVFGRYQTISVDLKILDGKIEQGKPLIENHPPH